MVTGHLMTTRSLNQLNILIKSAGEMATGIACRLYRSKFRRIVLAETDHPLAVRRAVSFCEAVHDRQAIVEGITALRTSTTEEIESAWQQQAVAVIVDPDWQISSQIHFDVIIDAILAKKNLGTNLNEAQLVIGMGPGFTAGVDGHRVIETNRGHDVGRVIEAGTAEANTGIPGEIGGYTSQRVLRAPCGGRFESERRIGESITSGEVFGSIEGEVVSATIDGVIRGLIRPGSTVPKGMKIGDVDPRGISSYCFTISDKARSLGGAVLEAVLAEFNT